MNAKFRILATLYYHLVSYAFNWLKRLALNEVRLSVIEILLFETQSNVTDSCNRLLFTEKKTITKIKLFSVIQIAGTPEWKDIRNILFWGNEIWKNNILFFLAHRVHRCSSKISVTVISLYTVFISKRFRYYSLNIYAYLCLIARSMMTVFVAQKAI